MSEINKKRILVIDDDEGIIKLIKADLTGEGYDVDTAITAQAGFSLLDKGVAYDLVMLDVRLPDADGTEALKGVRARNAMVPIVMISAFASVDIAVKAVKSGAYDFIAKPFELDELHIRVRNAIESHSLSKQVKTLSDQLGERYGFDNIIGKSECMQRIFSLLRDISASEAAVLITGESGTGKELVARAIHANSPRRSKPFVVINSAAIPETLLESELFGHEKGAFTGAIARKIGKFEAADGGSVFLDEIGDLSPSLQVKLLRVLQEKEFERVGGLDRIKVDVRIISATNKDLEKEVQAKRFREDLYYRLNVLQVELPPLRDRHEDIPMLIMHFLGEYAKRMNKDIRGVSKEAMEFLMRAQWRGNIRELENSVERAVVMAKGDLLERNDFSIPEGELAPEDSVPSFLKETSATPRVKDIEREVMEAALKKCGGNVTMAAKKLGIGRDTMYRKMRTYGIEYKKR